MAYQELMPVGVNLQPGGKYKIGDTVVLDENGVYVPVSSSQLDADLNAIAGLSGVGFAVRTANNTWALRSITGIANQVIVQNGDGVSGNVVLSTPQNLHVQATPTFSALTLTPIADGDAVLYSLNKRVGGNVSEAGRLKWKPDADQLILARTDGGLTESDNGLDIKSDGFVHFRKNISIKNMKFNAFTLRFRNNGGVIEHSIVGINYPDFDNDNYSSAFVPSIIGPSGLWAPTPDGNTFTNGVRLFSSSVREFVVINTDPMYESTLTVGVVSWNSSGTPITVAPRIQFIDGRYWYGLVLRHETSGAAFPIDTSNLPDGTRIHIKVIGYI
jgi:hypothetical protein